MKTPRLAVGCLLVLALAGCIVSSVCPYYTPKDLVWDDSLVGDWTPDPGATPPEIWRFDRQGDHGYRFTLIEDRRSTTFEAHLFELKGHRFVDVASTDQDLHNIPPHWLLRLERVDGGWNLSQFAHDWLRELVVSHPESVAHHLIKAGEKPEEWRVVLTAGTPELQAFIAKHLSTPEAWAGRALLKRVAQK